jgi:hypothetical protein
MVKDGSVAGTYKTSPGRECVQVIEHGPKPQDQIGVAVPNFFKSLGLLAEYEKEGFDRVAAINFGGERAVEDIFSGLLGVLG